MEDKASFDELLSQANVLCGELASTSNQLHWKLQDDELRMAEADAAVAAALATSERSRADMAKVCDALVSLADSSFLTCATTTASHTSSSPQEPLASGHLPSDSPTHSAASAPETFSPKADNQNSAPACSDHISADAARGTAPGIAEGDSIQGHSGGSGGTRPVGGAGDVGGAGVAKDARSEVVGLLLVSQGDAGGESGESRESGDGGNGGDARVAGKAGEASEGGHAGEPVERDGRVGDEVGDQVAAGDGRGSAMERALAEDEGGASGAGEADKVVVAAESMGVAESKENKVGDPELAAQLAVLEAELEAAEATAAEAAAAKAAADERAVEAKAAADRARSRLRTQHTSLQAAEGKIDKCRDSIKKLSKELGSAQTAAAAAAAKAAKFTAAAEAADREFAAVWSGSIAELELAWASLEADRQQVTAASSPPSPKPGPTAGSAGTGSRTNPRRTATAAPFRLGSSELDIARPEDLSRPQLVEALARQVYYLTPVDGSEVALADISNRPRFHQLYVRFKRMSAHRVSLWRVLLPHLESVGVQMRKTPARILYSRKSVAADGSSSAGSGARTSTSSAASGSEAGTGSEGKGLTEAEVQDAAAAALSSDATRTLITQILAQLRKLVEASSSGSVTSVYLTKDAKLKALFARYRKVTGRREAPWKIIMPFLQDFGLKSSKDRYAIRYMLDPTAPSVSGGGSSGGRGAQAAAGGAAVAWSGAGGKRAAPSRAEINAMSSEELVNALCDRLYEMAPADGRSIDSTVAANDSLFKIMFGRYRSMEPRKQPLWRVVKPHIENHRLGMVKTKSAVSYYRLGGTSKAAGGGHLARRDGGSGGKSERSAGAASGGGSRGSGTALKRKARVAAINRAIDLEAETASREREAAQALEAAVIKLERVSPQHPAHAQLAGRIKTLTSRATAARLTADQAASAAAEARASHPVLFHEVMAAKRAAEETEGRPGPPSSRSRRRSSAALAEAEAAASAAAAAVVAEDPDEMASEAGIGLTHPPLVVPMSGKGRSDDDTAAAAAAAWASASLPVAGRIEGLAGGGGLGGFDLAAGGLDGSTGTAFPQLAVPAVFGAPRLSKKTEVGGGGGALASGMPLALETTMPHAAAGAGVGGMPSILPPLMGSPTASEDSSAAVSPSGEAWCTGLAGYAAWGPQPGDEANYGFIRYLSDLDAGKPTDEAFITVDLADDQGEFGWVGRLTIDGLKSGLASRVALGGSRVGGGDRARSYSTADPAHTTLLPHALDYRRRQALVYVGMSSVLGLAYNLCVTYKLQYDTLLELGFAPAAIRNQLSELLVSTRVDLSGILPFALCDHKLRLCVFHESVSCGCMPSMRGFCRCCLPLIILSAAFRDDRFLDHLFDGLEGTQWSNF
ncbi:uncharacterized protein AMSG_04091 [Thecamonas trahens ATCC 50062]|uniref:Uncharacterized protein n=1 Tax=Thecamonas trahens ATCC 50062 TaxID=461836 RepID=A0A0L0D6Y4_THETB|nr:hypothetical protein AMSG_04091 [Thecamonas trahens ATCC 50062]KNC47861.1 hypothetical protein AMSG_04091 [Thecamonas trahens ATCC 50062]|eukprot:XP_013759339.1 hypothetical protein AMSG_04091 [Thecamonas trahens ATCC 50062]